MAAGIGGRFLALQPRQHVLHRELAAGFEIVQFLPGQRQGDRRAGSCPHRVIGDRGRGVVVAEEIDEDFPVALGLGHRRDVSRGRGRHHFMGEAAAKVFTLVPVVLLRERNGDMQSLAAGAFEHATPGLCA